MIVACVLKTGGDFDKDYVDALYESLGQYNFVCITDDPAALEEPYSTPFTKYHLKGWWSKFEAFELCRQTGENVLLFDLDTVIRQNITRMVELATAWTDYSLIMLDDFFFPKKAASGIMLLTPSVSEKIIKELDRYGVKRVMRNFRGDQEFLRYLEDQGKLSVVRWSNVLGRDYIASYKAHVLKDYPDSANPLEIDVDKSHIICFHGKPRPKDVGTS